MNVEGYDLSESAVRLARDLATAPAVVGVVLGGLARAGVAVLARMSTLDCTTIARRSIGKP
jgi:hypothetical protein